ncbi:MAG: PHP domain-containing protein [Verrucomicrobiae bacterium]|nr:PHP domain-containing protein [Verrucomicrobiae bacterium]
MLKTDLHLHSLEDPHDVLEHDAFDLVDHAARRGYRVLALTLHGRVHLPDDLAAHAATRGILMIPGVELYLDGREVLLLGAAEEEARLLRTLEDLRALKKRRGNNLLTIAPHPFYGLGQCLGNRLDDYAETLDAIELCHFYTARWNPNRKAAEAARRLAKPLVACSDTHQLKWMNHHYCLVDAEPTRESVFAAIREGKLRNVTRPLSRSEMLDKLTWHALTHAPLKAFRRWGCLALPRTPRR